MIHLPRVRGHGHRAGGGGHRGLPPRLEWDLKRVKAFSEGERQAPGGDPRHPRLGGGQRRRGGYRDGDIIFIFILEQPGSLSSAKCIECVFPISRFYFLNVLTWMFQSLQIQRRLQTPWFWPPGALSSPGRGRARERGRGWSLGTGATCPGSPGSPCPASPWSGSRSFFSVADCPHTVRDDRVVPSTDHRLLHLRVLHRGRPCLMRGCTDITGEIRTIGWHLHFIDIVNLSIRRQG